MTPYRTEEIDTPAGVYTVELHTDEDPSNPLEDWDHEATAFYVVGNRNGVMTDTLDDADDAPANALRTWIDAEHYVADIERRFSLWRRITGSPWVLVTGEGFTGYESYGWMVLLNPEIIWPEKLGYPPMPEHLAQATMADYQTWADGGVCGFITLDPSGDEVESCWGFYDEDQALEEGKDAADVDAFIRLENANLAGAGFIGIM